MHLEEYIFETRNSLCALRSGIADTTGSVSSLAVRAKKGSAHYVRAWRRWPATDAERTRSWLLSNSEEPSKPFTTTVGFKAKLAQRGGSSPLSLALMRLPGYLTGDFIGQFKTFVTIFIRDFATLKVGQRIVRIFRDALESDDGAFQG